MFLPATLRAQVASISTSKAKVPLRFNISQWNNSFNHARDENDKLKVREQYLQLLMVGQNGVKFVSAYFCGPRDFGTVPRQYTLEYPERIFFQRCSEHILTTYALSLGFRPSCLLQFTRENTVLVQFDYDEYDAVYGIEIESNDNVILD
jgi:hypothetical protein